MLFRSRGVYDPLRGAWTVPPSDPRALRAAAKDIAPSAGTTGAGAATGAGRAGGFGDTLRAHRVTAGYTPF